MWQIIPSTGRFLGLKQNWWYDGRRDIIESTRAATKYLKSLAEQFDNDWELALAAYNAGPGKVRSAIRYNKKKGRKTDFWHLTKFRRETKDYVPKLLALREIFAHPEKYDLELVPIIDEPAYELVELDSQLDLALAADLAGITTEQLYQLNPAFNRWATAPNGPHRLLLPRDSVEQFQSELAELPKNKRINWVRHKIKNGETLSHLAIKYRTTTKLIKQLNKIRGTQIRAGKYLLIGIGDGAIAGMTAQTTPICSDTRSRVSDSRSNSSSISSGVMTKGGHRTTACPIGRQIRPRSRAVVAIRSLTPSSEANAVLAPLSATISSAPIRPTPRASPTSRWVWRAFKRS